MGSPTANYDKLAYDMFRLYMRWGDHRFIDSLLGGCLFVLLHVGVTLMWVVVFFL